MNVRYVVKFINDAKKPYRVDRVNCKTFNDVITACKKVYNGDGCTGIEWCSIDSDCLRRLGMVNITAHDKVRLDTIHYA